jgi:hypothetical protein
MADYYSVIARAVSKLPNNTVEARQAVYERARTALVKQLGEVDPPLSEAEIMREQRAFAAATDRVENEAMQEKPQYTRPSVETVAAISLPEWQQDTLFAFLYCHFPPSIYWGVTDFSIGAPVLWSFLGAAYLAIVKSQTQVIGRSGLMILSAAVNRFVFSGALNLIGFFAGKVLVRNGGISRVAVAVGIAYLISGLHYVLPVLCRSLIKQPFYLQSSAFFASLTLEGLTWLSNTVYILHSTRGRGQQSWDAFSLVLFGVVIRVLLLV